MSDDRFDIGHEERLKALAHASRVLDGKYAEDLVALGGLWARGRHAVERHWRSTSRRRQTKSRRRG